MLGPQVEAEGAIPGQKAYGLNMRTAASGKRRRSLESMGQIRLQSFESRREFGTA
jgi:hypothetical protein